MCDLGTSPCPLNVSCFRLIFVGLGSLEILAETQLRCVSDLSLDALCPGNVRNHAVEALRIRDSVGKPWKTALKDDVKQIETGCKSLRTGASRVYTIYYIVSDRPRKWMSIHKLTHVA